MWNAETNGKYGISCFWGLGEVIKTCRDDVWLCLKTDRGWGNNRKSIDFDCRDIKDKEVKFP